MALEQVTVSEHSNLPIFGNDVLNAVYLVSVTVSSGVAMDRDGRHCNEQNVVNYGIFARTMGFVTAYLVIFPIVYGDTDFYLEPKGLKVRVPSSVLSSARNTEIISEVHVDLNEQNLHF